MITLYNGVRFPMTGPCLSNIERMDLGYIPIMNHMMRTGLPVDLNHFAKMDTILTAKMDELTEKVRDITGYYCNLGSSDQVAELLFKKMKLKQARIKMTKAGDRESTDYEVLIAIQHDHEAVPSIIEYKEVEKLRGTYVRPIPKLASRSRFGEWKLYPNLAQSRVPSGRNNCKEPNLLAMPNRTKLGREVCKGFVAPSGWCYLSVDVSQLEPRWSTHLSQDPSLIRIYRNNEDIYSDFAIAAFKLEDQRYLCMGWARSQTNRYQTKLAQALAREGGQTLYPCDNPEHSGPTWHYPGVHKKDHRFPAKTCILASFYEVSDEGLLEQMPVVCTNCGIESTKHDKSKCGHFQSHWTAPLCQELIDAFGMTYRDVIRMRVKQHNYAKRYALSCDLWGRILHVTAVRSIHQWVVSAALREAANFCIQSGGRGLVKLGESQIYDDFKAGKMLGNIIDPVLDVHDEILTLCRETDREEMGYHMINVFENCVPLSVPIKAGMAFAPTWGELPK